MSTLVAAPGVGVADVYVECTKLITPVAATVVFCPKVTVPACALIAITWSLLGIPVPLAGMAMSPISMPATDPKLVTVAVPFAIVA